MTWTVLVVEDDAEISTLLGGVLAARGFQVITAGNGAEALAHCRRTGWRPSVIVLDMMMPVMDGQTFLDEQARVPLLADVPVLIVSATPPDPLPPAVHSVLPKPIRLAALIDRIQEVCTDLRPRRITTLEMPAIDRPAAAEDAAAPDAVGDATGRAT